MQKSRKAAILARDVLALQEQREAILKIERDDIGLSSLFVKGLRQGGASDAAAQRFVEPAYLFDSEQQGV